MKKFMKAIAFATVMCLVLSTVAFAAVEVKDYAAKTLKITVEGVQKGEQVAVIVTKDGKADFTKENVLFVDQKAAGAATAEFNVAVAEAGNKVDVYAGYASSGEAVLVADDFSLEAPLPELVISLTNVEIVDDITEAGEKKADADTKGAAVCFTIVAENATENAIAGMAWGFQVKKGEEEAVWKWTAADATIVSALNAGILTGEVKIAAALDSTGYTILDAKASVSVNGEGIELVK